MGKRDSQDSNVEDPLAKKKKVAAESKQEESKPAEHAKDETNDTLSVQKTEDGDQFFTLGRDLRRVVVREFKGRKLVDIRDFYKDKTTGEIKPGKGVSLTTEQWDMLKANIHTVDDMIDNV